SVIDLYWIGAKCRKHSYSCNFGVSPRTYRVGPQSGRTPGVPTIPPQCRRTASGGIAPHRFVNPQRLTKSGSNGLPLVATTNWARHYGDPILTPTPSSSSPQ